jgi:hypothetical protein
MIGTNKGQGDKIWKLEQLPVKIDMWNEWNGNKLGEGRYVSPIDPCPMIELVWLNNAKEWADEGSQERAYCRERNHWEQAWLK